MPEAYHQICTDDLPSRKKARRIYEVVDPEVVQAYHFVVDCCLEFAPPTSVISALKKCKTSTMFYPIESGLRWVMGAANVYYGKDNDPPQLAMSQDSPLA